MPTRTVVVFVCSFCANDIEGEPHSFNLTRLTPPRRRWHYDVCDDCWTGETLSWFLAAGQARGSAPQPQAQPQAQAQQQLHQCPDCDFTHERAQAIGSHRAKKHGYVSPHRRG